MALSTNSFIAESISEYSSGSGKSGSLYMISLEYEALLGKPTDGSLNFTGTMFFFGFPLIALLSVKFILIYRSTYNNPVCRAVRSDV